MLDTNTSIEDKITQLTARLDELSKANEKLIAERDQYRELYTSTLELCRKLELGIVGKHRERLPANDAQLSLQMLGMLLGNKNKSEDEPVAPKIEKPETKQKKKKPTGRKPLPAKLPRVDIEVLPEEVRQKGLDAFEKIGEDVTETVERRPASLVVVRTHKPKFVPKGRDRLADTQVYQAAPPELPIERGLAGPGLLADTIVRRWDDHSPLYRLERIYSREGLDLARSTICTWHMELSVLAKPLIDAMWDDALNSAYLCIDATGVLVQAREKCHRCHFWVVAAPDRHVLFKFSRKHDSEAVDDCLSGYKGYLVADAHAVYDHLYRKGDVVEVGCWAHLRRYMFRSLSTDPERARAALALIGELFRIERKQAQATPDKRLLIRQSKSKPVVEKFFDWCDKQALVVLDETPISKGINYGLNQREALERFLTDGRLPIHNNWSERELRREAVGRKNWIFIGSDDGAVANTTFVTLLASCHLHGIEPSGYLRDLLCLLPSWPRSQVLDLCPAEWKKTLEQPKTQQLLESNVFRRVSLDMDILDCHRPRT